MRWLVLAALLGSSAPAHADELIPPSDWYPRATLGAGAGYWIGDVAALHPSGGSLAIHGEVRITALTFLRATIEHAWLTARDDILVMPRRAESDAYSAVVRHVLMGGGAKPVRFGADLAVLAGVTREHLQWDSGERLRRTHAVFGFGGAVVIYNKQFKPRHIISYGLRILASRAPDAGKLPFGCDGPCDMPTKTSPFDKTLIMELAWHFGR